jgi:hypothetical protein
MPARVASVVTTVGRFDREARRRSRLHAQDSGVDRSACRGEQDVAVVVKDDDLDAGSAAVFEDAEAEIARLCADDEAAQVADSSPFAGSPMPAFAVFDVQSAVVDADLRAAPHDERDARHGRRVGAEAFFEALHNGGDLIGID